MLRRFLRDQSGATAIEYAFVAMLISIACVSGALLIGPKLAAHFENVGANLR